MIVPVCLKDNQKLYVEGEAIGIWSVAPALGHRGALKIFTAAAWSVRSLEVGQTVGCFTERDVAIRFAQMLMREYGDISEAIRNCYNLQETPADTVLFDEIDERSKHQSRVRDGAHLPWVKP